MSFWQDAPTPGFRWDEPPRRHQHLPQFSEGMSFPRPSGMPFPPEGCPRQPFGDEWSGWRESWLPQLPARTPLPPPRLATRNPSRPSAPPAPSPRPPPPITTVKQPRPLKAAVAFVKSDKATEEQTKSEESPESKQQSTPTPVSTAQQSEDSCVLGETWVRQSGKAGVLAAIMAKMGYKRGEGLGKSGQGRLAPVGVALRPGRGAIGAYGSESKLKKVGQTIAKNHGGGVQKAPAKKTLGKRLRPPAPTPPAKSTSLTSSPDIPPNSDVIEQSKIWMQTKGYVPMCLLRQIAKGTTRATAKKAKPPASSTKPAAAVAGPLEPAPIAKKSPPPPSLPSRDMQSGNKNLDSSIKNAVPAQSIKTAVSAPAKPAPVPEATGSVSVAAVKMKSTASQTLALPSASGTTEKMARLVERLEKELASSRASVDKLNDRIVSMAGEYSLLYLIHRDIYDKGNQEIAQLRAKLKDKEVAERKGRRKSGGKDK